MANRALAAAAAVASIATPGCSALIGIDDWQGDGGARDGLSTASATTSGQGGGGAGAAGGGGGTTGSGGGVGGSAGAGGGGPVVCEFTEDFGTNLDKWIVQEDPATLAEIVSGHLRLTNDSSMSGTYVTLTSKGNIADKCTVSLHVVKPLDASSSPPGVEYFSLRTPNGVSVGFRLADGVLACEAPSQTVKTIPFVPSDHAWWALKRDSTNLTWLTSPDGFTWTAEVTAPVSFPDAPAVVLSMGKYMPVAGTIQVELDDVAGAAAAVSH